ncbi:MAG TPA: TetR/AcrR family transcriptional regulator [Alphaproteobacteria bacterium]|nr:TetR/AcrR family transcriptional regulator [Alphaproteobacteria bacterium]
MEERLEPAARAAPRPPSARRPRGRRPHSGGRPTRDASARLPERILEVATALFLSQGFGSTSIEAVAARARISKRTLYSRFADKRDLFRAVVRRLIERWLPPFDASLLGPGPVDEVLTRAAREILKAALSPEALALTRIMQTEARRFPELGRAMIESGARKGSESIAAFLAREAAAGRMRLSDPAFAAEAFMVLVLTVPQRRAMGIGPALGPDELARWAERAVALFLDGCRA